MIVGINMKIYGLQKMTLLDYPGHLACTVFLGDCNMRCPFCHNYELATKQIQPAMTQAYLMDFLKGRKGRLDGVAITGGEPCINNDLPTLLREIKTLGYKIKLDTNGTNPNMLRRLIDWNMVDYVAMDVKNSPEKYPITTGVSGFITPVRNSIDLLIHSGIDYEFRTTVVNELHTEEDFKAIGAIIHGAKRYALQVFTDRDTVPYGNFHAPGKETLMKYRDIVADHVGEVIIRGLD